MSASSRKLSPVPQYSVSTAPENNEAENGGGAIWAQAFILGNGTTFPYFGDAELTMSNCDFRRNKMDSTSAPSGGGAVFLDGMKDGQQETNFNGTITNCRFFDNEADRGGGIYLHSTDEFEISTCRFIGNDGRKAGGGIGLGDPEGLGPDNTKTKICKSLFVSNTSLRGGAVHNHEDAVTWMVNCRLLGNHSDQEGGAVFNSKHTSRSTAELYMHNCIIAGNVADGAGTDQGGAIFTGFDAHDAYAELVHCTLVGNYAGDKYGGAVNAAGHSDSHLITHNCITWGNSDADGGTGSVDEQLFYTSNTLHVDDVDNNVIDTLDDTRFTLDDEVNTDDDPVFTEDGSSTVTWTWSTYDPDTGETTFSTSDSGSAAVGMLFQPDGPETPMLIITYVGNSSFMCLGWRADTTTTVNITGKLYDLHIDSSGGADDWGDAAYIGPRPNGSGDVCDLDDNPTTNTLPYDLDTDTPNARNQNGAPDSGAYEIPNG
jgi:hypothetical protein